MPPISAFRLVAVGDLILGDTPLCQGFGVGSTYPGSEVGHALGAVRPLLQEGTIVFGNLEGVLLPDGVSEALPMCAKGSVVNALKDAGFTVLNVANNHAMEYGEPAFVYTVDKLASAGMAVVGVKGANGWACAPVVVHPHGGDIRLGILGYSCRPRQFPADDDPAHAVATPDEIRNDIQRLRRDVDVVVVSLHWGEDHVGLPSSEEDGLAQTFLEAGAHVILGHHPQVIRPWRVDEGRVVAYSLGTLVGDHTWLPRTRRGVVLELELTRRGVQRSRATPTYLGGDFRPRPLEGSTFPPCSPTDLLDERSSMTARRRAAWDRKVRGGMHVIRNLFRYPGSVRWGLLRKFLPVGGGRPGPRQEAERLAELWTEGAP